ncbi:MAG: hypothetical protein HZC05_01840 [Candidatus Magasanikbacteria bacterium]|nr:hypothetical protein [Candidatus Magasanikbacteria bacterium]
MKGNKVCALTNIALGVSEEQVIIMVPYSPDGSDGPWELKEVARISGSAFNSRVSSFGRNGRIPGIELGSRKSPSIRVFNFQTFAATRPEQDVHQLTERLPFLKRYISDVRRCMSGGDERVKFLRGIGSMNALLRPSVAS